MATARPTIDHDEIRRWVEARGGHPASVKQTGDGNDPGILRIDFPGYSGADTLEAIEWDEFFDWFDRNNLAMLLSDGRNNRFSKFVDRASVIRSRARKAPAKKAASKKTSSKKTAPSKKSASKKAAPAKKAAAKKAAPARKAASKKAVPAKKASTKKAATKKVATKKVATKRVASKKASTKKAATKKASPARKAAPAKKSASKKTTSKKAPAKKAAPARKAAPAKKAASTKKAAPAKKSATKKTAAKKAPAKKATAKKASRSSSSTITTVDHDEIRNWVESRGGYPATVAGTEDRGEEAGLLRIDYPGYSGEGRLERIEWDAFFEKFDEEGLAFLYQDKARSRFSKLVRR